MKIAILEYFNLLGIETTNERIKDFSEHEITAYHKTCSSTHLRIYFCYHKKNRRYFNR